MTMLEGKTALITGASQGLGAVIAESYVRAGASVCLCARSEARLKTVASELEHLAAPGQVVTTHALDLMSLPAIDTMIDGIQRSGKGLDILVLNAGIHGDIGLLEDTDWDQWVAAIHLNLISAAYLMRKVIPWFKQQRHGKIIALSGGGATKGMPRFSAYAASKCALVRLCETVALELQDVPVDVNCIAPGAMATRLLQDVLDTGPGRAGATYYEEIRKIVDRGGDPPQAAADLAVYLGSSRSDRITGKLISAKWDPWEDLAAHRDELRNSDVYTLRRITPGERRMDWGER